MVHESKKQSIKDWVTIGNGFCKKGLKHKGKLFQKTQTGVNSEFFFCSPVYSIQMHMQVPEAWNYCSQFYASDTICELLICSCCSCTIRRERILSPPPVGSL